MHHKLKLLKYEDTALNSVHSFLPSENEPHSFSASAGKFIVGYLFFIYFTTQSQGQHKERNRNSPGQNCLPHQQGPFRLINCSWT